jgi:hypothetical protein
MSDAMLLTLVVPLSAAAGFTAKSLWNYVIKRQAELDKQTLAKRLDFLGAQLSNFYWPLYLRLEKDNLVWQRILGIEDTQGSLKQRLGERFEAEVVIPNHLECVKIIESHIHLAQADEKLLQELIGYIDHVALYKALRAAGEKRVFPFEVGCPYPVGIFASIRDRTIAFQSEYDRLVKVSHIT